MAAVLPVIGRILAQNWRTILGAVAVGSATAATISVVTPLLRGILSPEVQTALQNLGANIAVAIPAVLFIIFMMAVIQIATTVIAAVSEAARE